MVNVQLLSQRYGAREGRALYELIMSHHFGLSRTDILLGKDTTLSAMDKEELQIIVDRVAKGEPVQYVLGVEEFCEHEFLVAPGVLIPRPETQQLVELVRQNVTSGGHVLDIGTGSGCIAITLALDGYRVTAIDVSEEALSIARKNAERLGADVEFVKADILSGSRFQVPGSRSQFSMVNGIVSNPPYICESEAKDMDDNVLKHEPHLALFVPDNDPLLFYRAIADFGLHHLTAGGQLLFEANRAYVEQVGELLQQKGYDNVKITKDLYDNERFVSGRKL